MGISAIHGWGCYAGEYICEGEFITEYLGDLITPTESNLRDAFALITGQYITYKFDLTNETIMDAGPSGGIIKFANSQPKNKKPNMKAKVVMYNGDFRMFNNMRRARDIRYGEELFFDYGEGLSFNDDGTEVEGFIYNR